MDKDINKFHALQLFTDTFAAETVHLTNKQIGIYIRLLCFAWTKNTKPFKTEAAYRICQCIDDNCKIEVDNVLDEFFKRVDGKESWYHKRLVAEHDYLTAKYRRRSEAGTKGARIRHNKGTLGEPTLNANSKTLAPIPIPKPIPNNNIYEPTFEKLWNLLDKKRGSKFKAHEIWLKSYDIISGLTEDDIAKIYNNQIKDIEDNKFVPHFSTWLSQRRWENEDIADEAQSNRTKMENLGYIWTFREDHFDYYKKDGKEYKIDRYDKDHIIHKV